jgi:hypothetical protein
MSSIISRPQSQIIMEGIESPYINKDESRSIQEPGSINILSTTIPVSSSHLMFDSIPSRTTSALDGPPTLPKTTHTSPSHIPTINKSKKI